MDVDGSNTFKKRGRPIKRNRSSVNIGRKPVTEEDCSNTFKKRGRPLKRSRSFVNTGRKRITVENCSKSTMYRRANEMVESAVAFYLENDYSKRTYNALFKNSRKRNSQIYHSYSKLQEVFTECKPEGYNLSESECFISLQNLLNKTAERLCESMVTDWEILSMLNLELTVTIGFDSSSGHSNPQQDYQDVSNEKLNSQHSLFISHMIVVQLNDLENNSNTWFNPTPQSIRFCRPLRIAVEKEYETTTLKEHQRLNQEKNTLKSHKFKMENGKKVKVQFNAFETLLDGKCLNTVVRNAAACRCPMCLRTSHQFKDWNDDFTPNTLTLKHGLGLLHCEIKSMEYLLKLSYRRDLQVWDVRKHNKAQLDERKRVVQNEVYEKIGVRVDQLSQLHGTTNTGNVARKCFSNPKEFSAALGIDEDLVTNVANILLAFKCKKHLNLERLQGYCKETYQLNYNLYPWSRLSPTVHKLLRHGCDIAKQFPLPMMYFSEDALESWHKLYRRNVTSHARQNSRSSRILDVFNHPIYLSDPKISLILIANRIKVQQDVPSAITRFLQLSQIAQEDYIESEGSSDH